MQDKWEAGIEVRGHDTKAFIASDSGVRLYVHGVFATLDDALAYVQHIAERLNRTGGE